MASEERGGNGREKDREKDGSGGVLLHAVRVR